MKNITRKIMICTATMITLVSAFTGCGSKDAEGGSGKKTSLFGKKEVTLADYLEYSFTGYESTGSLEYSFDYEALYEDLDSLKVEYEEDDIMKYIQVAPDKTQFLSNGDTVEFDWDVSGRLEEKVKASFIYEDLEVTVEGLKQREELDPFKYITVEFSGTTGEGYAELKTDDVASCPVTGICYQFADGVANGELRNGDTITVVAYTTYGIEQDFYDQGYALTSATRDYTVYGLTGFAQSMSQLPEELIEQLKKQGNDTFLTRTDWTTEESIDSVTCIGYYFLSPKNGVERVAGEKENYVFMAYEITVTNPIKTLTYYYYVGFSDIIANNDGTFEVKDMYDVLVPNSNNYSGDWIHVEPESMWDNSFRYNGYETIDSMFNAGIREYSEHYNVEKSF